MRYSVHRSSRLFGSAFEIADINNAIRRAMEIIEESPPGTEIYVKDGETGRIIREDEIRDIFVELPPQSRSMFGDDDA